MSQSDKREFLVNVAFVAVILALGYLVLKYLAVWMTPFIVGLVLAILLQRPVNWMLRHSRLERKLVAPVVTLVLVAVIVALLSFLVGSAVSEAAKLLASLPGWFQSTAPGMVSAVNERLEIIIQALPGEWEVQLRAMVSDGFKRLQSEVGSLSAAVLSWVANSAASLPGLLISFIITIVATFFICADFERVRAFFWRQVPAQYKGIAGDTWATFAHTLGQMLTSYLLIMFITFCELAVGLSLLRVEYSLLLAALIAMVDIFPVIGTGTILIPWGLVLLLTDHVGPGAGILLLYVAITVIRNILEPRIIGKRIGLHPLVTLIFMYLGLHLFGVPGMFLLPLIFILLKHAQEAGMIRLWKD